ncbi:PTS lactose/cellobiose transporter subunit IIA [Sutcliffiella horikoshii]|uniref:PTS cellobiose transporter subunit IIA n=1 Tax=Sutcliffiella horikoshii TaxID=79883 RepID=A0A1Y0CJ32_9BACI|nr:PTS lactose/cellobiose transporter subunit IIA [Sutcliffiella horikoshii]ART75303.1 PTS cellobiose transporter subunit IIA [Sutcliffiella horikoshii]TYS58677.1 PTS lactose/cellobiose transporter subunit IIA [Sutcliffiella horikoshii]
MKKEQLYDLSFQLILHSGNARSLAMEALLEAKKGEFQKASELMEDADEEFLKAHRYQTELIQEEARGDKYDIPILLVHAQDHLMNALTVKDLTREFIALYQKLS